MKITTNFDKEKGLFVFPFVAIGYKHGDKKSYRHKDKELNFVFMFACWAFSIEFIFK